MLYLRDLPKYEAIEQRSKRYPDVDAGAVQSFLVLLRIASDVLEAIEQFLRRPWHVAGPIYRPDAPEPQSRRAGKPIRPGGSLGRYPRHDDRLARWPGARALLKRQPDREDRRMLLVELTRAGRKLLDAILPDYYRRIVGPHGPPLRGGKTPAGRVARQSQRRRPGRLGEMNY